MFRFSFFRSVLAQVLRVACGGLAVALCDTAAAQPPDDEPFHWLYAAGFGSGVYRLADGTETRVVRLPFAKRFREPGVGSGPGVRLLMPITVGVQRDDEEPGPQSDSDRVEAAAFVPGIELDLPRGERWTLRVRGQIGWGKELDGDEDASRLYAVGIRSRVIWPDAPGNPALINGLLWAGVDTEQAQRRSLLRLTNAVEFDIPVPRWEFRDETMHLKPHLLGDSYYTPPDNLSLDDDESRYVTTEWQIGLAAGRETGFKLLWFEVDAIGIAYRFSDYSEGIRFFVGSVF